MSVSETMLPTAPETEIQKSYLVTLSVERQRSFLWFFTSTSIEIERRHIQGADSEYAAGQLAAFRVQGAVKAINVLSVINADQKSLMTTYDVVVETKMECSYYKSSMVSRHTVTAESSEEAKKMAILDSKFESQRRLDTLKHASSFRDNLQIVSVTANIYSQNR